MRVQNIDPFTAQKPCQTQQAPRIGGPVAAIATETRNPLGLHVLPQPRSHGLEGAEEHLITAAVMPACQLREEAAGIAVLREMQDLLHQITLGRKPSLRDG